MLNWNKYIEAGLNDELIDRCRSHCLPVFRHQRETLSEIVKTITPKTVACLGAGCLNDIPIFDFFRSAQQVYLVDWIPRISEEGFKAGLIEETSGRPSCRICELGIERQKICMAFVRTKSTEPSVCDNFVPVQRSSSIIHCANFKKGSIPNFLTADITASRSTAFTKIVNRVVETFERPEKCFRKAIQEAVRCGKISKPMPIPSNSADLVTSSMVISQFDVEPYEFFSQNLVARFGKDAVLQSEEKLLPLMIELRDRLFLIQAEGHIQEIHRIVNKASGKVYLSVELFRTLPGQKDCFVVKEALKAMELLDKYFTFDFDLLPSSKTFHRAYTAQEKEYSVVQSYVLTPRG